MYRYGVVFRQERSQVARESPELTKSFCRYVGISRQDSPEKGLGFPAERAPNPSQVNNAQSFVSQLSNIDGRRFAKVLFPRALS